MANFASEHDPCDLYGDIQENVEILRVLLLLIIEPSTHNTSPHLLGVLDRYKGEGDSVEDLTPSPYLTKEMSLLLQSTVMAIETVDTDSLLFLEDELAPKLSDQQRGLLRVLVNMTIKKV